MARRNIGAPKSTPVGKARPRIKPVLKKAAFRICISAESRTAALLIAKGFRILARRWKSPVGDIDAAASRRSSLVFSR
jgi:putative endonuclease